MSKIMKLIGIKSRKASERKVDINTKNKVLNFYAKLLDKEKKLILKENLKFCMSQILMKDTMEDYFITQVKE